MLMNLFSIFDPSSYFANENFISIFLISFFCLFSYWKIGAKSMLLSYSVISYLSDEIKTLLLGKNKGKSLYFTSLILFIMTNNFMGLFPYIFTYTSHLVMTLSLSLPVWLAAIMFGWVTKTRTMLAHLIPPSTSYSLMPFMVCAETISITIRPLTLAIRLSTNMIAGHLLMVLLSDQAYFNLFLIKILVTSTQIILIALELGVSIIQAYVLSTLSTLYAAEST